MRTSPSSGPASPGLLLRRSSSRRVATSSCSRPGIAWADACSIAGAGGTYELFEPEQCLAYRVVGGSQLLPLRLAERLGDRVVLDAPARTIRWSDGRVEVETGRVRVVARAAVVAVPPNLTGGIRFEPAPPGWRLRLEQNLSQGVVIKATAVYDHPF